MPPSPVVIDLRGVETETTHLAKRCLHVFRDTGRRTHRQHLRQPTGYASERSPELAAFPHIIQTGVPG